MPNWIGDFVLALSLLQSDRGVAIQDRILIVPKALLGLARHLSSMTIIPYDRSTSSGYRSTLAALRENAIDTVSILPFSWSSAWLAWRARIPCRRGLALDGRWILLTQRLPHTARTRNKHILHEYAAVLGIPFVDPGIWAPLQPPPDPARGGYIALCPGAKYGPSKKWPHFADLVSACPQLRFVVVGGLDDAPFAEELARLFPDRVRNTAGATDLGAAIDILQKARAVVSNDSGLMHVAAFLGVPVVGIFGSTTPRWTRPLGERTRIITTSEQCSPCMARTCRYGHYRCLTSISAERVRT